MTGRERVYSLLEGKLPDRLSWSTLVDNATLKALPGGWNGMSACDFYRRIGCDIFLLNGWGTPYDFMSPRLQWDSSVKEERYATNSREGVRWIAPKGILAMESFSGHPIKFPVGSLNELKIYREMWEGASFVEVDDAQAFKGLGREIGKDGICTRFWGPSAIPSLLENIMGVENFYCLMADFPAEMERLINLMHQKELEAFKILSRHPCDVVMLCENTSTAYISPYIYRRFNCPHQRDFVDIMHEGNKTAIIHMCGHLKTLLADVKSTGADGIHALTPPPTGNTPWEMALDVLGDETIIVGALDPAIFLVEPVECIPSALDKLYTPRLRRSNFMLCPFADGIEVPLERFLAVSRWMEKNGSIK